MTTVTRSRRQLVMPILESSSKNISTTVHIIFVVG